MNLISRCRNYAVSAGLYFCYLLGACILTMLVEAMLLFFLDHLVLLSYPVQAIIRIVIYTVGISGVLGVLGYYEGYREVSCSVGETVAPWIPVAILHLLLAMLFKFQAFISGAVRFLAGFIHKGWKLTIETLVEKTPYSLFLLVFLGYTAWYILIFTICKYLGAQKRICDRAELRKNERTANEDV